MKCKFKVGQVVKLNKANRDYGQSLPRPFPSVFVVSEIEPADEFHGTLIRNSTGSGVFEYRLESASDIESAACILAGEGCTLTR